MKVNCTHWLGPDVEWGRCGIGLPGGSTCLRDCPARVPKVPDTPACFPTLPPILKPPPPLPIQQIPKGYRPGSEGGCCDPPPDSRPKR